MYKGNTIVVTQEDRALPVGCSPSDVAAILMDFFDAVNRYDPEQLARLWMLHEKSESLPRYWYGMDEGDHAAGRRDFSTSTIDSLLAYFSGRHRQRERMRLLAVDVGGPREDNGVDVAYYLARSADDLPGGVRIADAKGAIDCKARRTMVASLSTWPAWESSDIVAAAYTLTSLCPPPPPERPRNAVIACARP